MSLQSRYDTELDKNGANFVALTPIDFLARAALVHPQRTAIICGTRRQSYKETYERCRAMADALTQKGIGVGDTVSIMAPNILEMLESLRLSEANPDFENIFNICSDLETTFLLPVVRPR